MLPTPSPSRIGECLPLPSRCPCALATGAFLPLPQPQPRVPSSDVLLWLAQVANRGGDELIEEVPLLRWPTCSSRCPGRPRGARLAGRIVSKGIMVGPPAGVIGSRRFVVEPPARGSGARVFARGSAGLGRGRFALSFVVAHVCRACGVSFARMVLMHGDVEAARAVCLVLRTAGDGTGWYAALDGRLTVHSARI